MTYILTKQDIKIMMVIIAIMFFISGFIVGGIII